MIKLRLRGDSSLSRVTQPGIQEFHQGSLTPQNTLLAIIVHRLCQDPEEVVRRRGTQSNSRGRSANTHFTDNWMPAAHSSCQSLNLKFLPSSRCLQDAWDTERHTHQWVPELSSGAQCAVSRWALIGSGSAGVRLGRVCHWPLLLLSLFPSYFRLSTFSSTMALSLSSFLEPVS